MKASKGMPSWVYWALWGINSRKTAMRFFNVSLVFSVLVGLLGIIVKDWFLMSIVFMPLWYWFSVNWVDKNGQWPRQK